jgi:Na+-transporting methylmalonyl-CoA/oxaloacetate decarboxylase gamma subunit
MVEGLFISLVGMAAVFVSLTVIMFLMMGIERVFRSQGVAVQEAIALGEGLVTEAVGPEDAVEVAAVALALASHLRERGRELGTTIAVDGLEYEVDVGDTARPPVAVAVNGESFRGSVGEERLSLARTATMMIAARLRRPRGERVWRSAYPLPRGDYWCRRGWTGRKGTDASRS